MEVADIWSRPFAIRLDLIEYSKGEEKQGVKEVKKHVVFSGLAFCSLNMINMYVLGMIWNVSTVCEEIRLRGTIMSIKNILCIFKNVLLFLDMIFWCAWSPASIALSQVNFTVKVWCFLKITPKNLSEVTRKVTLKLGKCSIFNTNCQD